MMAAIKLVISENGKLLDTVNKETKTQPEQLIKSLEEFQRTANQALTKLIEQNGGDLDISDDADENEDEAEDDQVSPRKKKK